MLSVSAFVVLQHRRTKKKNFIAFVKIEREIAHNFCVRVRIPVLLFLLLLYYYSCRIVTLPVSSLIVKLTVAFFSLTYLSKSLVFYKKSCGNNYYIIIFFFIYSGLVLFAIGCFFSRIPQYHATAITTKDRSFSFLLLRFENDTVPYHPLPVLFYSG